MEIFTNIPDCEILSVKRSDGSTSQMKPLAKTKDGEILVGCVGSLTSKINQAFVPPEKKINIVSTGFITKIITSSEIIDS